MGPSINPISSAASGPLRPRDVLVLLGGAAAVAAHVVAKTVRDSAFLAVFDVQRLPLASVATAVVTLLLLPVYARVLHRFGPQRVVSALAVLIAASLFLMHSLDISRRGVAAALFVWTTIASGLCTSRLLGRSERALRRAAGAANVRLGWCRHGGRGPSRRRIGQAPGGSASPRGALAAARRHLRRVRAQRRKRRRLAQRAACAGDRTGLDVGRAPGRDALALPSDHRRRGGAPRRGERCRGLCVQGVGLQQVSGRSRDGRILRDVPRRSQRRHVVVAARVGATAAREERRARQPARSARVACAGRRRPAALSGSRCGHGAARRRERDLELVSSIGVRAPVRARRSGAKACRQAVLRHAPRASVRRGRSGARAPHGCRASPAAADARLDRRGERRGVASSVAHPATRLREHSRDEPRRAGAAAR